mmetsp:Transcript_9091/g.55393  ORF Transcript_9091/g.55393 Transcript_9091/m.55393 type:complete len:210 (+) Transcript_9091:2-631(+)
MHSDVGRVVDDDDADGDGHVRHAWEAVDARMERKEEGEEGDTCMEGPCRKNGIEGDGTKGHVEILAHRAYLSLWKEKNRPARDRAGKDMDARPAARAAVRGCAGALHGGEAQTRRIAGVLSCGADRRVLGDDEQAGGETRTSPTHRCLHSIWNRTQSVRWSVRTCVPGFPDVGGAQPVVLSHQLATAMAGTACKHQNVERGQKRSAVRE